MGALQMTAGEIKGHEKRRRFLYNHNRMDAMGLNYTLRNGGHHAIVSLNGRVADFWPATERWEVRGGPTGFGIDAMTQTLRGYQ